MVQTLVFFTYIGLVALIFCKTEGTTYVDALYFEVVTTLTIGFGDITPTTTAFKVLTFPFTIVGITLLALNATSILKFLADRGRRRKMTMKRHLKKKERKQINEQKDQHTEGPTDEENRQTPEQRKRSLTLQDALHKFREDSWKHERAHNLRGMITGLLVFFSFWFLGAMIFNFVEVIRLISN
jgi:potassium channel subfamily K, other eukaryote